MRPVHRMVAHSGFLTTAVRCQPRGGTPPQESAPANDLEPEDQETGA